MDFLRLARSSVRSLSPYKAGTTVEQAKRQFNLEHVVKLSSNENSLGPSPLAMAALATIPEPNIYLDDEHPALKAKIAARFGVAPNNVALGHGSNDILNTFFATFVEAGDEVVMADPTFSLFGAYARLAGAVPVTIPLRDGVHDLEAMLAAVTARTKVVVVCDPNNPTSTCVDPDDFARFAAALPEQVLLVLDQAYQEFMPARSVDGIPYALSRPGTIVTRTMSKLYGLASIRFGYGFADAGMIELMQRVRVPFNVSAPAAIAASAALDDHDFVARTIAMNTTGRAYLEREVARLGLTMFPSAGNFIAMSVPSTTTATTAYTDLLKRGVVVRSGDALHLPGYLRITIGTQPENEALVGAIEDALPAWRDVVAQR